MKRVLAGLVSGVFVVLSITLLQSGKTSEQMGTLYKDIGSELIDIRKSNPHLQATVYSLLDQVGKMYRLSTETISKKKTARLAVKEQKETLITVKNENENLRGAIGKLKSDMDVNGVQMVVNKQQVDSLTKEAEVLRKKVAEFDMREKALITRVKEIEHAADKHKDMPSDQEAPLISKSEMDEAKLLGPLQEKIIAQKDGQDKSFKA